MLTLTKSIASQLLEAHDSSELPLYHEIRIQVTKHGDRVKAFAAPWTKDPLLGSKVLLEHKQMTAYVGVYSRDEVEESLEEIFPNSLVDDPSVPDENLSVRIVTRKVFEDAIDRFGAAA